jgi:hypothetical protein
MSLRDIIQRQHEFEVRDRQMGEQRIMDAVERLDQKMDREFEKMDRRVSLLEKGYLIAVSSFGAIAGWIKYSPVFKAFMKNGGS